MRECFVDIIKELLYLFCFPFPIGKKCLLRILMFNVYQNLELEATQRSPPQENSRQRSEATENAAELISCPILKGH